jgi:hypothetical protein
MLNTYLKIAQHLFDKMPDIQWLDRDKGQIDHEEQYHTLVTPAILLDFNELIWQGTGRGNQLGEGSVIVKLVFSKPGETFTRGVSPLQDYTELVALAEQLHLTMGQLKVVKERRKAVDYFTTHWYVIEMFYDLEVPYEVPVRTIPKPEPKFLSTIITIQQDQ